MATAKLLNRAQDLLRPAQPTHYYREHMPEFAGLFFLRAMKHAAQGWIKLEKAVVKRHCGRFESRYDHIKAVLHEFDLTRGHGGILLHWVGRKTAAKTIMEPALSEPAGANFGHVFRYG
jgi:hypothetical protein